jgi:hypothetical protein
MLSPAAWARIAAIAATLVFAGIVLAILRRGRPSPLANGTTVPLARAMIIDRDTSTYSLSKMQLYVWMFAALSAYLYLLAANVIVLGRWQFVEVPQSIVKLSLISVGTSVLATGVTSVAGGKGSGPFLPAASDLITSGGDVAPERVQQLLWTALGAPAFLLFAYVVDPAGVADPQTVAKVGVPDQFLALMGVSAAGYVGGKIARGPGPKITSLTASLVAGPPPFLMLSIRGSGIQTKGISFTLLDTRVRNVSAIPLPATILPSSVIDSSGIATVLELSVPSAGLHPPDDRNPTWGYDFTLLAPDGEKAEWPF